MPPERSPPPLAPRRCAAGLLGETHSEAAFALPIVGFVATAISLGVVNVMVAMYAAKESEPLSKGVRTPESRAGD